jgi:pimeloyl-ACP methyl ester carboxylesterase
VVVAPVRLNSVELSRITIKILGMWGGNDNISDPKEGERLLKECRNAQVIILENAGHACYLDRPIEFNEAISNFLSDS